MILDFISEILSNFVVVLKNRGTIEKLDFLMGIRIVSFYERMTLILGYEFFDLLSQDSKPVVSKLISVTYL